VVSRVRGPERQRVCARARCSSPNDARIGMFLDSPSRSSGVKASTTPAVANREQDVN
jgi:hypothetical protein